MKTLVVVTVDLPEPEDITKVLDHMDCPKMPHFAGTVRIVPDPLVATALEAWLDAPE